MGQEQSYVTEDTPPLTLSERSLAAVADYIKSGRARRIVVMTGAGISTAAGIPDFRSPDTGLYANLAALDLPEPEAVFDLGFFRQNPAPFYALARELYPGARYRPTIAHVFVALLARKGLLRMLFTQNIDCLERAAGVPPHLVVEAHGSFATQSCIDCKAPFADGERMRACVARGEPPRCETCGGLVKPDIVFFGEALPRDFFEKSAAVKEADLILVMGTSLQVHPFAGLPNMADPEVPRVLFNLQQVGSFGTRADDVMVLGDCDAGVRMLADELGWREELESSWRKLVGDEEAERQLQGAKKRVTALRDEVTKLADEVEEVLHIGDKEKGRTEKDEPSEQDLGTPASHHAGDAQEKGQADATPPAVESQSEDKKTPHEGPSPHGEEKADGPEDAKEKEKAVL
ncbi:uncharacterized protein THITE_68068 [Thermothielavioides terrestris NRRL 8126]|uniref:NAD-dependent protein deacetylase n=2 Tax=Thermothielavioides terrestris TaxID=2587410 RepID=G2R0D0_THETT|nr:uncharacterized protein THITE_68068 [Thermothielavioides terrestris NRRL 8126]AEO65595.1 hypothetical protein THITE_68068 [Thermothielavioides terrestris NRRL 8126]